MYKEFYGFTKDPFLVVPDPSYLYMSPKHEEALARITYGIRERRAVMLLTGEVGAGKTTLVNYVLGHLPASIQAATITNPNLDPEALLRMILVEFKVPSKAAPADKSSLIKELQNHLTALIAQNRRGLLVIDEAQNLPLSSLEEIRMLNNLQVQNSCLVQILLVGQPELRARMKDPRYVQIAQRIAFNYHIDALTQAETRAYIDYRLVRSGGKAELFTADAAETVYRLSRGVPRMINLVCDSALIYGFAEGLARIDQDVIARAAKQLDLMGLVNAASGEAPAQATSGGGNGRGARAPKSSGRLEESLSEFITALREETRKICAQTAAVTGTAAKLTGLLEKVLVEDRAGYDRLCADSAKLELLRKLIASGPKD